MSTRLLYFAGSIRGGRDDAPLYALIIQKLCSYGTVLTEHVGDASLAIQGEDGKSDSYIYERDMSWLKLSSLLVAEVTTPSLGVGYEIAAAELSGTPVLCLFRPDPDKPPLSAMLTGNPGLVIKEYHTIEDVESIFKVYFAV